jgi:hypothetical protein
VSTLAFAPRRGGGQAAGAAPIVRVVLARAALAAGVWLLAGLLVATWPKWAAR